MSRVSARERAAVEADADARHGVAGLVQCEGCPPGVLVPKGGPYDGMCPGHWHQTEFRYGPQGGVSHI